MYDKIHYKKKKKSLLQHRNLKASIHQYSAFFMAQFSHLYMTTGKTVALTVWIDYFKCLLRYIPMASFKPRLLSIRLICRFFFKPLFCILIYLKNKLLAVYLRWAPVCDGHPVSSLIRNVWSLTSCLFLFLNMECFMNLCVVLAQRPCSSSLYC